MEHIVDIFNSNNKKKKVETLHLIWKKELKHWKISLKKFNKFNKFNCEKKFPCRLQWYVFQDHTSISNTLCCILLN